MRTVVTFAALALAASIMVPRYAPKTTADKPAAAMMAAHPVTPVAAPATAPADSRSVVLTRNAQGHFEAEARVDSRRLSFMVDTGASTIALTESAAASLGIHPSRSEFTAMVRTANGTVAAAPVTLDRVEIDDIVVHDVAALVLPEGALSQNLLGMTFMSRLRRWEFADGKLVLEQ